MMKRAASAKINELHHDCNLSRPQAFARKVKRDMNRLESRLSFILFLRIAVQPRNLSETATTENRINGGSS